MTAEDEKIETCRVAMKAALEAIQDYCGTTPMDDFSFPDEIYELATSDKDVDQRIKDVKEHGWTKEQAEEVCGSNAFPFRVSADDEASVMARGIVLLIKADGRTRAEEDYAKTYRK